MQSMPHLNKRGEKQIRMPGDHLVPNPMEMVTKGIMIKASPERCGLGSYKSVYPGRMLLFISARQQRNRSTEKCQCTQTDETDCGWGERRCILDDKDGRGSPRNFE